MRASMDVLAVMELCESDLAVAQEAFDRGDKMSGLDKSARRLSETRAAVAELIDAHKDSIAEIERLRDAMFRVYATTANGRNATQAIEAMRDEMDKPWSVDRSRAALARIGGAE